MKPKNPYISWKIRCINSQTKEFFDRCLVLDKSSLSQEQFEQILDLEKKTSLHNKEVIKYRNFFRETQPSKDCLDTSHYDYFGGFCISDYVEDENEKTYDEVQLFSLLTGYEKPVILGNLRSILQYGHSPIIDKDTFSQKESDTLAHFIQAYSQIVKSQWYKEKCKLISRDGKVDAFTPTFESLVYVSIYFRQLYSKNDRLFEAAIETYSKHIDCRDKIIWLRHEFDAFQWQLKSTPLPTGCAYSTSDLIDAFLYGALVIHSNTCNHKGMPINRQNLKSILDNIGKKMFAFELNTSLRFLLCHVSNAANLIRKDFSFWLNQHEIPQPDVLWHETLFDKQGLAETT